MAMKLGKDEIMTVRVLKSKGESNREIARTMGVAEGTVRYHLSRAAAGAVDGRSDKPFCAETAAAQIGMWMEEHERLGPGRPANVKLLHDHLAAEHGYKGSYKSVLRYVRAKYPPPKIRPYRRVETPPGAQAQVDWGEFSDVDIGEGPQKLHAFVMVLSHSRKEALVWCRRMDQLSWHRAHNEALRRLGGVPAVVRIDNLKTGMGTGAGPWGEVNASYQAYARAVRFHVDPCLPRSPEAKGKVENRVGNLKRRLNLAGRRFEGLADLQAWTDGQLERSARGRLCPATGRSVEDSWWNERPRLQTLPVLPEAFDLALTRRVHGDCTVNFEGRSYSVPFTLTARTVEARGCADTVQILHDGAVVAEHPRHTEARLVIDPAHYEGEGDERVAPPTPLGRLGRRMEEIVRAPVEKRPLDLYAALAEAAR